MPEQPTPPPVAPEPLTSQLRISTRTAAPLVWAASLFALIGGGAIIVLLATGMLKFAPGADTPAGKKIALQEKAVENAEFGKGVDQALHRVSWTGSQDKLLRTKTCCQSLLAILPQLEAELTQLATDEAGRRIASRAEWIDQFIILRDHKRLTVEQVNAQQQAVGQLLVKCNDALANDDINIECPPQFMEQVAAMLNDYSLAETAAKEDLRLLQTLKTIAASTPGAPETLAVAVEKRKLDLDAASLQALAAAQAAQRDDAAQRRQQLVLEADRKVQDAELAREESVQQDRVASAEAETERQRQAAELAAQRAAAEAAHRKKLAAFERDFPAMKSLLAPFISRGKLQLQGASWVSGEEGPVSLAAIEQSGALKPNGGASYMLMYFGNGLNGRPAGSFPRGHANDQGEVRQVQEFLIEYGDILVEKKLLRP